jgi:hypothetical protein
VSDDVEAVQCERYRQPFSLAYCVKRPMKSLQAWNGLLGSFSAVSREAVLMSLTVMYGGVLQSQLDYCRRPRQLGIPSAFVNTTIEPVDRAVRARGGINFR